MRVIIGTFLVLVAAIVAVVAADRPIPPAELTVIIPVPFNTLDPQRQSYSQDIRLTYAIGEGLTRWNNLSEAFEIVPALAESWEISDDRRTYTFKLQPDAGWSNGSPVTAHDIVYSWRRGVEPELVADYATLFFHIEGAEDYFNWRTEQLSTFAQLTNDEVAAQLRARNADVPEQISDREQRLALARLYVEEADAYFENNVGLRALDDKTLEVVLERPTTYFLDLTAFAVFSPIYPPPVERHTSLDPVTGRRVMTYEWTKPPLRICNGPYVVTRWKFKRAMLLERNEHYWNPDAVKSDSVKIIPISDLNTSVLAFQNGVADLHMDVRVDYIPEMLAAKQAGREAGVDQYIHAMPTFGTYFWSFNCTPTLTDGRPNPFHDPAVRRAFCFATDREAITQKVRRSGEQPASTFIPPGSIPGFDTPRGQYFDPERARAELASAGWEDRDGDGLVENANGDPFPVVELLYSTASYHEDIALALGQMWKTHLGVKTELDGKETKVYKDELKKRDYMLARGGWFGDYGDPTTFLDLHRTGNNNNDRGYSDPVFDEMMRRAEAETDPEVRNEILEEAERYTMEETTPILVVYHYAWWYLYEPPTKPDGSPNPGGLRGMSDHPRLVQYLWQLEVVSEDDAEGTGEPL